MRMVLDLGRRVSVHLLAAPKGDERVVVLCHSAPGAGTFDPDPLATEASGAALLSVDRPGYGFSDPVAGEWATVASAADDLAAVLDSLGVVRAGVAGWSAGGRVALALAARRPDLVDRLVVAGTPAPDGEVPWVGPEERAGLERLRSLPPEDAYAELVERLAALIPADPFAPEALWLLATGAADDPALRVPGARARLGAMLEAAFVQGARGMAADIAGYCLRPWGFEPEEVHAKTLLLFGSRDPIAGPRHGRWWQSRLPDARLEVAPGAGHLLVIPLWSRILSHLAPRRPHLTVLAGGRNSEAGAGVEEFSAA